MAMMTCGRTPTIVIMELQKATCFLSTRFKISAAVTRFAIPVPAPSMTRPMTSTTNVPATDCRKMPKAAMPIPMMMLQLQRILRTINANGTMQMVVTQPDAVFRYPYALSPTL